jgi:hypothetical protein
MKANGTMIGRDNVVCVITKPDWFEETSDPQIGFGFSPGLCCPHSFVLTFNIPFVAASTGPENS